ncbi:3-deoxy-D-manno-octulosonic acid transferase [Deminuibacter soli]|uniref:3-deoxy-D-manno-octulosonic acid transferase n=1 Tax=Deminuibacter soli TaxID=2291815 RepID=A0A3E1NL55_9BACT|nr:glycosyltransferase N-terminal domain-containing protein [Deminuibacter soli]RFM28670.1 3-deoxy-D-manno-octulosonic acid transferase [Deminuibacter soli]
MGQLLYTIFTRLYPLFARLLGLFNPKAAKWVAGRNRVFNRLQQAFAAEKRPVIWVHCASLGEFEQGRPVMEALKQSHPQCAVLLTFFSPSGYEVQQHYAQADYVYYLPMDSPRNAARFLAITRPVLILFIKYEFWYYYLQAARKQQVPLLLVSGMFREQQPFFKWYGSFHRSMLGCFTHFFVQTPAAAGLLKHIGVTNVTVSGDTRFDRVLQIAQRPRHIDGIEDFCGGLPVLVAGSTWTDDDEELDHYVNTHPGSRFIIAPHDIGEARLRECEQLYKHAIRYSAYLALLQKGESAAAGTNTLIIDNIGMLSRLYQYATICYVGGGFGGDGIHNILEAAVYHKPVVFGPVYDKYIEGVEMIEAGGALSVPDALHLEAAFERLLSDQQFYNETATAAGEYVASKAGATGMVLQYVQEKRLLTS